MASPVNSGNERQMSSSSTISSSPSKAMRRGSRSSNWSINKVFLNYEYTQSVPLVRQDRIAERRTFSGHLGSVNACSWSADSQVVASVASDGQLILWNTDKGTVKSIIRSAYQRLLCVAYEKKESRLIASGGQDATISIYDMHHLLSHPRRSIDGFNAANPIHAISASPEKTGALDAPNNHSREYPTKCNLKCDLKGQDSKGEVTSVDFLGDATRCVSGGTDGTIRVWDVNAEVPIDVYQKATVEQDSLAVTCLAVSPTDPNVFVSGSLDGSCRMWDARISAKSADNQCSFDLNTSPVNSVAFFPDGQAIAFGSDDGVCSIFDLKSKERLTYLSAPMGADKVSACTWSASGRFLFVGYGDSNVRVFDLTRQEHAPPIGGDDYLNLFGPYNGEAVTDLQLSPDGKKVFATGADGHCRLFS